MPPKRKQARDLPDNLYPALDKRDGVLRYKYRDPRTGRQHGMGSDKAAAMKDARALNAAIYASMAQARVTAITTPVADTPLLSAVILKHSELCEARHKRGKLAANTITTKRSHGEAIRRALGHKPIGEVSVLDIAALLASYVDAGKDRAAQAVRSEAIEIWKTAISQGWIKENAPAMTRPPDCAVKRERLTLDAYKLIRECANGLEPWVGLSMDLAMVTAQRREDIAMMEFKRGKDSTAWVEDGSLWVIQSKTGNRVCIPLDLYNAAIGLTVGDVVARCRDRVVSRFLIHHRVNKCVTLAGGPVWKDTISRAFAKARDLTGLTWQGNPPSFHEMRSRAVRDYTEQYGPELAQALAGHKDAATTAIYRDVRGSEWVEVKTG